MKTKLVLMITACFAFRALSAQVNSQLQPDQINFRDGTKIKALLDWDGTHLGLYNTSGKTGNLLLGSDGDIIFKSGGDNELVRLLAIGLLGLGTSNPGAKLGITHHATATIPHFKLTETDAGAFAGIRFNNINSSNYWQINSRTDTEPLFKFSFYDGTLSEDILTFDGLNQNIAIGNDPLPPPNAKLSVHNYYGGDAGNLGNTYSIYTRPGPSIWTRVGLYSYVSGAAEGVDLTTQGQKIAVNANARSSGNIKVAVSAYAGIGTGTNYGLQATVNGIGGAESYAVYGSASGGNGSSTPAVWAGYFAGDVYAAGSYLPSDKKLKTNIQRAASSLERIRHLQVNTYRYQSKYQQKIGLDRRLQTGFIAQEVAEYFPELTRRVAQPLNTPAEVAAGAEEEFLEFTGVNYVGLIPHLTQAIQEQQIQIEALQANNKKLLDRLAHLEARLDQEDGSAQNQANTIELTNATLQQNSPNPFSETTRIAYFIPEMIQTAQLEIVDAAGRVIKNLPINSRGQGEIELQTLSLSAGLYTYSLILNGRIVKTKQMVLIR